MKQTRTKGADVLKTKRKRTRQVALDLRLSLFANLLVETLQRASVICGDTDCYVIVIATVIWTLLRMAVDLFLVLVSIENELVY